MKKWFIGGGIAAILVVVAIIVGTKLYASQASSDIAAPTLSASPAGSTDASISGDWTAGSGSYAGYRVAEVLNGDDVTVVGRTEQVTGTATVTNDELTAATVEVDLASVKTDSDRRDGYFANKAIDLATYPKATFTVTKPQKLTESGTQKISGDLTIKGKTVPVVAELDMARTAAGLETAGKVDVTWQDFGVEPPNMGFVSVADAGSIEFFLKFTK